MKVFFVKITNTISVYPNYIFFINIFGQNRYDLTAHILGQLPFVSGRSNI